MELITVTMTTTLSFFFFLLLTGPDHGIELSHGSTIHTCIILHFEPLCCTKGAMKTKFTVIIIIITTTNRYRILVCDSEILWVRPLFWFQLNPSFEPLLSQQCDQTFTFVSPADSTGFSEASKFYLRSAARRSHARSPFPQRVESKWNKDIHGSSPPA